MLSETNQRMNPYNLSDSSVAEFQRLQQSDGFISQILKRERLPRSFVFLGPILFHRKNGIENVVIPTMYLQSLIDMLHNSVTGQHFSTTKIEKHIRKFFFVEIRILRNLLKASRRRCDTCQKPQTNDLNYAQLIGSDAKTFIVTQFSNDDTAVTLILDPQTRMLWSSVDRFTTPFSEIWKRKTDLPFKIHNVIFTSYQPDTETKIFLTNLQIKIIDFNDLPPSLIDFFAFFQNEINYRKNVNIDTLVSDLTKTNNDLFLPFCPNQVKYSSENFQTLVCKNILSDPEFTILDWHVNTKLMNTYGLRFYKQFPPKKLM